MFGLLWKTVCAITFVLLLTVCCFAGGEADKTKAANGLPDKIGDFRGRGSSGIVVINGTPALMPELPRLRRTYIASNGETFDLTVVKTPNDSSAYALMTAGLSASGGEIKIGSVGTASMIKPGRVEFVKGNAFVNVVTDSKNPGAQVELVALATAFAQQLDSGENDIPVLLKHLPNWETVQPRASYVVALQALKDLMPQQHVLDAVSFEGSPEATLAKYDAGKLLIIEFNTAKIAGDNDWNIKTKINELRAAGASANDLPSAYRRVGNYSVFVFDAPSEPVANELIDQVKYQQVVQWLGNDPYAYERATREFTETTLGVFVSVVKASGLALVTCLGVGGLFGALLFSRRRTRQRNIEAYSDAGGMLRLNLDELTPETDPARLIGPGVR
jgi:hypothetical protein